MASDGARASWQTAVEGGGGAAASFRKLVELGLCLGESPLPARGLAALVTLAFRIPVKTKILLSTSALSGSFGGLGPLGLLFGVAEERDRRLILRLIWRRNQRSDGCLASESLSPMMSTRICNSWTDA